MSHGGSIPDAAGIIVNCLPHVSRSTIPSPALGVYEPPRVAAPPSSAHHIIHLAPVGDLFLPHVMLFDSSEPITIPCARTVEPAIHSLLRLGIMQEDFVDHVSRALGIVRCVLDHEQSIPRKKLAVLGRSLWARMPHLPDVPRDHVEQVRSIIMACVEELRELSDVSAAPAEAELPAAADNRISVGLVKPRQLLLVEQPHVPPAAVTEPSVRLSPSKGNSEERHSWSTGTRGLFGTLPPRSRPRDAFNRNAAAAKAPSAFRPSNRQRSLFDAPAPDDTVPKSPQPAVSAPSEPQPATGETATDAPADQATEAHQKVAAPLVEIAAGERAKARDIVAAVRTLRCIEREGRSPLPEQHEQLARFSGFGPVALSIFPHPLTGQYKDEAWQKIGEELKGLLTTTEYESAKRTTFNAFYTSPAVIAAIHDAIARLGVPAEALVLEPGCGIGNFLSYAPKSMRFIGVELDSISGRIARQLHPGHDIRIENFRDTVLPDGSLDAVVGNVPFADLKLDYGGQKLALHDFFLAKSIDALRPGGVLALVTSHFTLDKQNGSTREQLAAKADFVGAIRLPSDAFKRQGTMVVTDILFLRRRAAFDPPDHADPEWTTTAPLSIDGIDVSVNRYFLNHPEMVLGSWTRKHRLYGDDGYGVASTGNLATLLAGAVARLPRFAPLLPGPAISSASDASPSWSPDVALAEGSFLTDSDGTICQWLDGQAVPVVYAGVPLSSRGTLTGRRMAALIGLRTLARRVLASQNEDRPEAQRHRARQELSFAYDRFTANYGPINKTTFSATKAGGTIRRMPNLVKFREDPDAMLVMSLEVYDESTGRATKSAIMLRDVVGRVPDITSVQTVEEGLLVSLNQRGNVDLPYIADLSGKLEDAVIAELGDLVYHDPETKVWQTADAYLSGNVRAKLKAALDASAEYIRNADALAAVQPDDVLPGDIDCNLGAPWIPAGDIRSFAADLFRVDLSVVEIGRFAKDAVWSIEVGAEGEASVAATSEYGTARAHGVWLLDLALNMKTPVIYDTVMVGDREERVVNETETLAAREKQRQIKDRFRAWIFSDAERTERLVRIYNDTFNNLRPRHFDGSHLDFPGMNQTISLMAHQRAAVWRCMCAGNTLLAQTVGAGKTFIMAAAGMKMKQAGLIRKPLYVVPNHMLEQFGREFLHLYPNAQLLIAGKDDLTRGRRKLLTAKIASSEWDGIVVTHSSFERIGMSRDYKVQFIRDQIHAYAELLCGAAREASRASRNIIKTIEKQKARYEERVRELLADRKKDDGLVFDELGIDYLFVDEAHYCKNLETPSKMQRVAGIQTAGSERAFDLLMKARYLHAKNPGHGVAFATGTPISNTMVEMYTMQRYLDPAGMEARGIEHFDAWAATFGEVIDAMEISPDGASLHPRSRFAKFTNLPELQQMFRSFADVQTADMLDLPRPELETGKAQIIACPMSDVQRTLQEELVARYERIRSQKIDPSVDNALAITTDGRKLALEARLLDQSAPDFPGSKVNALVERVLNIWRDTAESRSTQLVFCDLGVRATASGYSVYDDVLEKLRAGGIPASEIAAIGDADSDGKKQALFERVRAGHVRVLLGSTQKMGMGTNVQKRLIALHHLDAPWKPAEVEQREGRVLRPGNDNKSVAIYRYVTEGSFDAYMWQALETKARFIAQVMTGQTAARRTEDIGSHELSYAEVKAIASGNPAVLTLAETDAELQRLAILKKNHADEQYLARRNLRDLPGKIVRLTERLTALDADGATVAATADRSMMIEGREIGSDMLLSVLGERLFSLPPRVSQRHPVVLGDYRGLAFGIILYPHFPPEVFLEGALMRCDTLSRDHHGPRAVLNALERLAGSYDADAARARQELAIAEAQLRDYQLRFGKQFFHDAYIAELTALRDALKALLSGASATQAGETGPRMGEIVDRIKTLRAKQTIDALPQRTGVRLGSVAAEPITERIRRRMGIALTA
jgi:N12 class adenine-specific DNA methylase